MAESLVETRSVSESRVEHLEPMEVAAYVDGTLPDASLVSVEAHLAECAECRDEVVDTSRIAARLANRRPTPARIWLPVAAAAALVLFMARPNAIREREIDHREAPVTSTVAPRAVSPVGMVDSLTVLLWTSVPHTDRYLVRVFEADGSILWERETVDTVASIPASIALRRNRTYSWKVEAQTGFGRSAATELVDFSIRGARSR